MRFVYDDMQRLKMVPPNNTERFFIWRRKLYKKWMRLLGKPKHQPPFERQLGDDDVVKFYQDGTIVGALQPHGKFVNY